MLNAVTKPFYVVNFLGSYAGGNTRSPECMLVMFDHVIAQLHRVYRFATQHFDFQRQLTLDNDLSSSSSGRSWRSDSAADAPFLSAR